MPSCSVCGYAVEWVRSTYSSAWRFFVDRPDVLVAGQYVRCPPGTPHFDGLHNFGSANWRRGTDEIEPALGEPLTQRQRWTRSEPLPVFPLPLLIGDRPCIRGGDTYASRAAASAVFNGFLVGCWRAVHSDIPVSMSDIPLSRRSTLISHANILNLLYSDPAAATAAAIALLGPGTVVTVDGSGTADLSPVTLIATHGDLTLVFVTGTTNNQQLALQAMFSLIPPSSMAGYGTNPLWQAAAGVINDRIQAAGVPVTNQIRFVGHSYGAAASTLLAAQYHRFIPGRVVELLTFGMPKPGDSRLRDLLEGIPSVNVVNSTDPVPSMPPSLTWLFPFIPIVEGSILDAWSQYVPPPNQFILAEEGVLTPSTDATFSTLQLALLVADAVASTPPPLFPSHGMGQYYTNINFP